MTLWFELEHEVRPDILTDLVGCCFRPLCQECATLHRLRMDMQCHEVIQMTAVTTASADRVQLTLPGGRTPSGGGNWLVPSPPPLEHSGHDGAREGEDVDVDSDPAQRKLKGVKSAPACLEEPDLACTNSKDWQQLLSGGLDLIQRTDLSGTKSPVMPFHSTLQV